jgi:uncharacterized Zn finger protein (UPF0148 family)
MPRWTLTCPVCGAGSEIYEDREEGQSPPGPDAAEGHVFCTECGTRRDAGEWEWEKGQG